MRWNFDVLNIQIIREDGSGIKIKIGSRHLIISPVEGAQDIKFNSLSTISYSLTLV